MKGIVHGLIAFVLLSQLPRAIRAGELAGRDDAGTEAARCDPARGVGRLDTVGPVAAAAGDLAPARQWVQAATLTATAAAISADGSTVVTGDPGRSGAQPVAGSLHVWVKGAAGWGNAVEVATLTASDGATGDGFPSSVSLSADGATVVAGAAAKQVGANANQGAAYVFTRSASGWASGTEAAKLVASDGAAQDQLGSTVAIGGDGAAVMAAAQVLTGFTAGKAATAGEVYVFERPASGWASGHEQARLTASDARPGDLFGFSIAISADGSTAAVGAPWKTLNLVHFEGVVYVFVEPPSGWASGSETAALILPPPTAVNVAANVGGGVAISADGSTVAAGAPARGVGGVACVFVRPPSGWVSGSAPDAELKASDGVLNDALGASIAVSADGSLVVAGAPIKRIGANEGQGQAYTFARPPSGWAGGTESARLLAAASGAGEGFGGTVAISGDASTTLVAAGGASAAYLFEPGSPGVWVPAVSHTDGANGSRWRSDVAVLNLGSSAANLQVRPGGSPVAPAAATVPAHAQVVLSDVAGQLGLAGSASLEIASDQPVVVASRTYSASGGGTVGQSYSSYRTGEALAAGQSAWLPQLTESAAYRSNISLTNAGASPASVDVELHDGAGTVVAAYTVALAPGEWKQENRPFAAKAGLTALDQGYAKVSVTAGYGVIAAASVVDNVTNDPATIEAPAVASTSDQMLWVPVASHGGGANRSEWRSDLAVLNPWPGPVDAWVRLHAAAGVLAGTSLIPAGGQGLLADVVGRLGGSGSGALEVYGNASTLVASRTYSTSGAGTVGQSYRSHSPTLTPGAGQWVWLPQLTESAAYRTNISLTNVGLNPLGADVELYDGAGTLLASYHVDLAPGEWRQENRPFFTKAGRTAMDSGYAKVTVASGYGLVATASVVDNATNDPRTVEMVR